MVSYQGRSKRALALGVTALLMLSACSGTTTTPSPATQPPTQPPTAPPSTPVTPPPGATATPTAPATPTPTPVPTATPMQPHTGGTMFMLMSTAVANGGTGFQDMDPQRAYTGEDMAFLKATIERDLTAYVYSDDPVKASALVADAATDTGTASDGAKTWTFTIRDGMKWQDGSAVTCEDFKYGVSRTFATDVIVGGPTYAIAYLDIPTDNKGNSKYPGPYKATPAQQALFDAAVQCDGNTITFHLNKPIADFNYTVTLGFGAVPNPVDHPGADTGEQYDTAPWSDGPYMIDSFSSGIGGSLVLKRNPNWDASTDTYRGAYPDQWVVQFGIDPVVMDQRLMNPTGNDQYAVSYGNVQPQNFATIFSDPHTANADFAGRAFSDYDPYSRYYWIRTDQVPNQQIRQAMGVALNRDAIRTAGGGDFTGDFADGVIKPNIGQDYAATHLWDASGPFGEDVPPTGDANLATQLIQQSGETPPTLTWDYVSSPVADQVAGIVQSSLQAVGFTVNLNAIPTSYYAYVLNPDTQDQFGGAGWGPDWPNASTVIPPLFSPEGGFDLSRVGSDNYADFYNAEIANLSQTDRGMQATEWQALNTEASTQMFVIPTFFGLAQNLAGTGVGNLYRWGPYGSWPYAQLYVMQ
jgi:peptide/nickel transport system substrate-binding protein